jgi:hypothetical protein
MKGQGHKETKGGRIEVKQTGLGSMLFTICTSAKMGKNIDESIAGK